MTKGGTIKKLEEDVYKHLKERGWHELRPGDLAKSIAIESGELLEIFQWANPVLSDVKKDKEKMKKISGKLADVLTYCLDLSTSLGLNTEKIVRRQLAKVKKKYPARLMKKMAKESEPGTDSNYWQIKKVHRGK